MTRRRRGLELLENVGTSIRVPRRRTGLHLGTFPLICKRGVGRWFVGWWRGAERGEEAGVDEADGVAGVAFWGWGVVTGDPLEGTGAVGGALLDGLDERLVVGGGGELGDGRGAEGWIGEG